MFALFLSVESRFHFGVNKWGHLLVSWTIATGVETLHLRFQGPRGNVYWFEGIQLTALLSTDTRNSFHFLEKDLQFIADLDKLFLKCSEPATLCWSLWALLLNMYVGLFSFVLFQYQEINLISFFLWNFRLLTWLLLDFFFFDTRQLTKSGRAREI